MEIKKKKKKAMKSLNPSLNNDEVLLNGVMGLCGESGEVIDILKKHLSQGHDLNRDKMIEELGDVAWYLAETAFALGVDLDTVLRKNLDKLEKRYPDGFTVKDSINRSE